MDKSEVRSPKSEVRREKSPKLEVRSQETEDRRLESEDRSEKRHGKCFYHFIFSLNAVVIFIRLKANS